MYEYDPLTGDPIPKSNAQSPLPKPPETPQIDATALEAMSREDLLALIKKMPGYPVALLTDDEAAAAILMRLKIDALTTKDARQAVSNANAWFDRVQGKALQRIDQRSLTATVDMTTHRAEVAGQAEAMMLRLAGAATISGNAAIPTKAITKDQ